MFRFSRSIIIGLGLAFLGEAKAQDALDGATTSPTIESEHKGAPNSRKSAGRDFVIPVQIIEDPDADARSKHREDDADARDKRDLAAQEAMAEYTKQAVRLSWWQLGPSAVGAFTAVVGTLALVYSLVLNRRATNAAVMAADAARAALGADRAWLMMIGSNAIVATNPVFGEALRKELDPAKHDKIFGYALRWRNDGRSPALKVRSMITQKIMDSMSEPPQLDNYDLSDQNEGGVVGPGSEVATGTIWITWELCQRLIRAEAYLWIYGRVEYEDTFQVGKARVSEGLFLAELLMHANNDVPDIQLRPIGPRNTAN